MHWWAIATLVGAVALASVPVWTDLKHRRIPHWVHGALVALWLQAAFFAPQALGAQPLAGLVCGLAGLGLGFGLYACGWLGGGDGKLLAVLAMWLGPADIGLALLATAVLGLALVLRARFRDAAWRRRGIPFALAIAPPAATVFAARAVS